MAREVERVCHISTSQCRLFERKMLKAEFESQPPQIRKQTMERVKATLEKEARSGQKAHSALWHLQDIYLKQQAG